jgi:hypothetical protein
MSWLQISQGQTRPFLYNNAKQSALLCKIPHFDSQTNCGTTQPVIPINNQRGKEDAPTLLTTNKSARTTNIKS